MKIKVCRGELVALGEQSLTSFDTLFGDGANPQFFLEKLGEIGGVFEILAALTLLSAVSH